MPSMTTPHPYVPGRDADAWTGGRCGLEIHADGTVCGLPGLDAVHGVGPAFDPGAQAPKDEPEPA